LVRERFGEKNYQGGGRAGISGKKERKTIVDGLAAAESKKQKKGLENPVIFLGGEENMLFRGGEQNDKAREIEKTHKLKNVLERKRVHS